MSDLKTKSQGAGRTLNSLVSSCRPQNEGRLSVLAHPRSVCVSVMFALLACCALRAAASDRAKAYVQEGLAQMGGEHNIRAIKTSTLISH